MTRQEQAGQTGQIDQTDKASQTGETIKLKRPVRWAGQEVSEVHFREDLTAADIIGAEDDMHIALSTQGVVLPVGVTNLNRLGGHLVARCIDRPMEFVEAMDASDFLKLSARARRFLG